MIGVGAHTVYVCACVRTSVYMCVCTLRCTLLSNLDVQNLQKLKRVRSLLLYDSAENTTCRLKAFSSQMSLGPQWRMHLMCNASAQCCPLLCPEWHHLGLQCSPQRGQPGPALFAQRHCRCSSVNRCTGLGPPQHRPPSPHRLGLHGTAENPQSTSLSWYIFILWNSNLFVSCWTFAAWVLNYEISLMVFEM
jgi:hypothetical protein